MRYPVDKRLTCGRDSGVSGAWCPCWKKPKLSLIRALYWSKIRNLLWCNFVHFKVQSCTGVTFLVVVCGNSNEKDTDKQAKRRNYFLSRKVELTLYYYTAPLRPCPHVSVLVFFFFPVWPTVHMYPGKTVTENVSFQKRSPAWRF